MPYQRVANGIQASLLSVALLGIAFAEHARADSHSHSPHAHGAGQLNLAKDAGRIEIEMILPGMDIVGFEHQPSSHDQRHQVEMAVKKLEAGEALFQFNAGAECTLRNAEILSDLAGPGGNSMDAHDDQEHHGKADHEEEHHDGQGHDSAPGHAAFHAHYQFDCAAAENLEHLDLSLFKTFPTLQQIDARTLTAKGQHAKELTPAAPRLTF